MNLPLDERGRRRALWSWALFDWANSAFPAIVQTFVFATYFTRQLSTDEVVASGQWGNAMALVGVILAISGPIFGAAADVSKRRKGWLLLFSLMCITSSFLMWFILPSPVYAMAGLALMVMGSVGAELSFVFYNAMLPDLAPKEQLGRWSGWGFAAGYAGGMCALLVALFVFVDGWWSPWELNRETAEHVRATFALAGVWYIVFGAPLFFCLPRETPREQPLRIVLWRALKKLKSTIANVGRYASVCRFLIARMLYIDGLATVFAFGGVFAAGTFGMTEKEVLLFGITLHVSSGLGAAVFGHYDDKVGGWKTIMISLLALLVSISLAVIAPTKMWFWIAGQAVGIFVGPIQASSRSYLSRMAPENIRTEAFGFYVLSGKATSFIGPLMVGWGTLISGSQRVGMATLLVFFISGALLMLTVPKDREVTIRG